MSYSLDDFQAFDSLLEEIPVKILGYVAGKSKCIKIPDAYISDTQLVNRIKKSEVWYPKSIAAIIKDGKMEDFVSEYCKHNGLIPASSPGAEEQKEMMKDFALAKDLDFTTDKEATYFLVNEKDMISMIPAHHYIHLNKIEQPEVIALPMIREYSPRDPQGIYKKKLISGEKVDHINSYIPPDWTSYEGETPDELPHEIELLFNQISDDTDRKFFLHWVYQSLTTQAKVYLVLNGDPAVGKNRINAVIRALHGHHNSVSGKKSTLTSNFNSQLSSNTYIHFDELKYSVEEEAVMKEIPNGSLSIEKKGEDATRSTRIFCSMVISNNKARDNYIAFDARKFAPLTLSQTRLEKVIPKTKITEFSDKIDYPDSPKYDVAYIAQIGRWILKHGNHQDLFPYGEYQGRKFWELAHSSMFHWQKAVVRVLTQLELHSKALNIHHKELKEGNMLFSTVQGIAVKSKNLKIKESDFPGDYSTARNFIDKFRGLNGVKVFETESVGDPIYGDFKIKVIGEAEVEKSPDLPMQEQEDAPAEDLL